MREKLRGKCKKSMGIAGSPCLPALAFILQNFLSRIWQMPRGCGQAELSHYTLSSLSPYNYQPEPGGQVSTLPGPTLHLLSTDSAGKHNSVNIRGKGKEKRHRRESKREGGRERESGLFKKKCWAWWGWREESKPQGNEYSGSGVGSAFDRDSGPGTFNESGFKLSAYTLNPAKH